VKKDRSIAGNGIQKRLRSCASITSRCLLELGGVPEGRFEHDPYDPPYAGGYGQFDGTLPYPESTFAPFTTIAGEGGSASEVSTASPSTAPPTPATDAERLLGLNSEKFEIRGEGSGLRINIVVPGSLADKAGLHVNDVIQSINGYHMQKPADLTWIHENAASDKSFKMIVQPNGDRKTRELVIQLP
jgi:hypothetical protein